MYYYRKRNQSQFYRDLRNNVDDKTVLDNPNKGWYLHFVDNGMIRNWYRDDLEEGYYLEDVPGLNQLYLRLDWIDIEKEEGVFDWSFVDDVMKRWGDKGYTFSFRFCTYEGGRIATSFATPKWVFDKGAEYILVGEAYEPKYDDPVFLEYLDKFLAECGRKFNGNPLVEYIDVGAYGTWGECHTYGGSQTKYPYEVHKIYLDMHVKHFPDTQLLLNYNLSMKTPSEDGKNLNNLITDYAVQLGLGLRCDSINVKSYFERFAYDTLETPDMYDLFNKTAPVDLEHEHYSMTTPERFRDGIPYIESLKTVGATYAGFHGYITKWLPDNKYVHEYIANHLGYWYFINGFALPDLIPNAKAILSLDIVNKGWAKAYNKYDAKVRLESEDGTIYDIPCSGCDNTRWLPNDEYTENIKIDVKGVPSGKYNLYFGLFKGDRAIKFAIKEQHVKNGYCNLGKVVIQ